MKNLLFALLVVLILTVTAHAALYDIDKDSTHILYGNLCQSDAALKALVGDAVAAVACGPVAVTNSYRYLEKKYGAVYDNSLTGGNLVQTAANLCGLMGTTPPGGTYWDDLIWYKRAYIEARVPGQTVYKAQYNPQWQWSIWDNPGIQKPDWVMPVLPTWQFLWQELFHCEDVEVLLNWSDGGHFLTVKSFHWNDVDNDGVIDFAENATFDFIDPCTGSVGVSKLWQSYSGSILETDYCSGANITMAVTESIPEPATLMILAAGILVRRFFKA